MENKVKSVSKWEIKMHFLVDANINTKNFFQSIFYENSINEIVYYVFIK